MFQKSLSDEGHYRKKYSCAQEVVVAPFQPGKVLPRSLKRYKSQDIISYTDYEQLIQQLDQEHLNSQQQITQQEDSHKVKAMLIGQGHALLRSVVQSLVPS